MLLVMEQVVASYLVCPRWVCPAHGTPLTNTGVALQCQYGDIFPVRSGIPRFIEGRTYADHFGVQWKTFARTQLDSFTGTHITRDRIRRVLGEALWQSLEGLSVLECGCGAGRFTEILLDRGARVTSVDLSTAVEANAETFPIDGAHRVAQADIMHLPFEPLSYDLVLCLGVIQHTPSPEQTIEALYRFVAPGGTLAIDHYAHSLRRYTTTNLLFREWMKRLPTDRAMLATRRLVDVFLPIHKRFAHNRMMTSLLSRISPIRSYHTQYPELSDDMQREWSLLDTHDSLTDWYKHLRTRRQIRRALERLGLADIWCEYGGNGVEARGKRPA
jgi:SAM-dependent methyltransferase